MKFKDLLKIVTKKNKKSTGKFMVYAVGGSAVLLIATSFSINGWKEQSNVYAAVELEDQDFEEEISEEYLPTGIAGVVAGVEETSSEGKCVRRIGTSFENVMVGQRVKTVSRNATELNLETSMENTVNSFGEAAMSMAENPKMMTDADYDTLLRIVEAEAGTEDVKGRVLVANVIMNRVKNEEFPNNVTDVVWDYSDGVPQFSPTYDGSIYQVTVTDETREAVKQALEGVDYSEGALFFIQKTAAEKANIDWFEKDLKKLFKYGVHEFYVYPTEEERKAKEAEDVKKQQKSEQDDLVQMVKNETP